MIRSVVVTLLLASSVVVADPETNVAQPPMEATTPPSLALSCAWDSCEVTGGTGKEKACTIAKLDMPRMLSFSNTSPGEHFENRETDDWSVFEKVQIDESTFSMTLVSNAIDNKETQKMRKATIDRTTGKATGVYIFVTEDGAGSAVLAGNCKPYVPSERLF